jgi:hypothetical protein
MAIAIFRGGGLHANTKARFQQAYNIAVAQCQKNGYVTGSGTNMKVTAKGLKHEREGMRGFVKDKMFDAMFAWIIKTPAEEMGQEIGRKEPSTDGTEQPDYNDLHQLGRNQKPYIQVRKRKTKED